MAKIYPKFFSQNAKQIAFALEKIHILSTEIQKQLTHQASLHKIIYIALPLFFIWPYFLWPFMKNNPDAWYYLSGALNIADGKGYVDTAGVNLTLRAPIIPFLSAFFFKLTGAATPEIGMYAIYLVDWIGILCLILLGKKIFGTWLGILGVSIVLSLPYVQDLLFMRMLTDAPQAMFLIVSLLFIILAMEKNRLTLWGAAGIFMGLALLTKESAVLWLPLPVLIWIFLLDRQTVSFKQLFIFYGCFVGTVLPWWIYVYRVSGNIYLAGRLTEQVQGYSAFFRHNFWFGWIVGVVLAFSGVGLLLLWKRYRAQIQKFFVSPRIRRFTGVVIILLYLMVTVTSVSTEDLLKYIVDTIQPQYPFLFVLIAWLIVFIWSSYKRSTNLLVIGMVPLFYLPILLLVARWNNEPRNLIAWMLISGFVVAGAYRAILFRLLLMGKKWFSPNRLTHSVIILSAIVWGGYATLSNYDAAKANAGKESYQSIVKDIGNWLDGNIAPNTTLFVSWLNRGELYVFTQSKYKMVPTLPEEAIHWSKISQNIDSKLFTKSSSYTNEKPAIIRLVDADPGRTNNLIVFYQSEFIQTIKDHNIDYILVTGERRLSPLGFSIFMDCVPYATVTRKVSSTAGEMILYKIDKDNLTFIDGCPTVTDATTLDWIMSEATNKPGYKDEYQILKHMGDNIVLYPGYDTQAVQKYLWMGRIYTEHGAEWDALQAFRKAASANSDVTIANLQALASQSVAKPFYNLFKADIFARNNELEIASELFDEHLNGTPKDPLIQLIYGDFLLQRGDGYSAIQLYQEAAKLDPAHPKYAIASSKAYVQMNKLDQANDLIANLEKQFPNSALVLNEKKRILTFYTKENFQMPLLVEESKSGAYIPVYRLLNHLDEMQSVFTGNFKDIHRTSFVIENQQKGVLFQHPPSQANFSLTIPSNARLRFSLAISPAVWSPEIGDGVQFDIYLKTDTEETNIFSKYIDPKNNEADRHWLDYDIDLSAWTNQNITLSFMTDPGPNGSIEDDWAGWGEPRIVQPVIYDFLDQWQFALKSQSSTSLSRIDTLKIGNDSRLILFEHPFNQIIYPMDLPPNTSLKFGLGVDPAVWDSDKGDGMEFNIYIELADEPKKLFRVFNQYIDPKNNPKDQRWFDYDLDLTRFGGQNLSLIFETRSGPDNDNTFDWGGWSTPVLLSNTQ